MTKRTSADITTQAGNRYPDGVAGSISASAARAQHGDISDSFANHQDLSNDATADGDLAFIDTALDELKTTNLIGINDTNSTVDTTGGRVRKVRTITVDDAIETDDDVIFIDATSGNVTADLPSSPTTGQCYTVKRTDGSGNTATLDGNTNTIDASATKTLSQWDSHIIIFDGSDWMILASV